MNYNPAHEEVRALRLDRRRVSDLLARYPRVSDEEVKEILNFLRTGEELEIGLLTSNERVRPKLDAFMERHKAHFRITWSEAAALAGGIAALILIFWLVWEAFN
jgi:hypothetical protein